VSKIDRRDAAKIIASSLFVPIFLKAEDSGAMDGIVGSYALTKESNGSFSVESAKEEVRFRLGKNGFLLRKNSKINIKMDGVAVKTLRLIAGATMAVFMPGAKTIEARTFTAGIRGTGIYLEDRSFDESYCCLCYGVADFVGVDDRALMSLNSRHHDRPVAITKSKSGKIELFDDKTHNHDDDELRALEKMCGRQPPFEEWLRMQEFLNPSGAY
jgi:hypothetical protein